MYTYVCVVRVCVAKRQAEVLAAVPGPLVVAGTPGEMVCSGTQRFTGSRKVCVIGVLFSTGASVREAAREWHGQLAGSHLRLTWHTASVATRLPWQHPNVVVRTEGGAHVG